MTFAPSMTIGQRALSAAVTAALAIVAGCTAPVTPAAPMNTPAAPINVTVELRDPLAASCVQASEDGSATVPSVVLINQGQSAVTIDAPRLTVGDQKTASSLPVIAPGTFPIELAASAEHSVDLKLTGARRTTTFLLEFPVQSGGGQAIVKIERDVTVLQFGETRACA